MFRITGEKGFNIRLENGYYLSVQFGPANYCTHYNRRIGVDDRDCGREGSVDAEVALLNPEGHLIETPFSGGDTVAGYQSVADFLKLLDYARGLPGAENGGRDDD